MANSKFLDDFILPALNDGRYGDRLKWFNKADNEFLVKWVHKGAQEWDKEDTAVFQGWDCLKGHYSPEKPHYLRDSKQRFRSALYKLDTFEELKPVELNSKVYYKRYKIKPAKKTKKARKSHKRAVVADCQQVPCSPSSEIPSSPSSWGSASPQYTTTVGYELNTAKMNFQADGFATAIAGNLNPPEMPQTLVPVTQGLEDSSRERFQDLHVMINCNPAFTPDTVPLQSQTFAATSSDMSLSVPGVRDIAYIEQTHTGSSGSMSSLLQLSVDPYFNPQLSLDDILEGSPISTASFSCLGDYWLGDED